MDWGHKFYRHRAVRIDRPTRTNTSPVSSTSCNTLVDSLVEDQDRDHPGHAGTRTRGQLCRDDPVSVLTKESYLLFGKNDEAVCEALDSLQGDIV
jgi:hypothetical protein